MRKVEMVSQGQTHFHNQVNEALRMFNGLCNGEVRVHLEETAP